MRSRDWLVLGLTAFAVGAPTRTKDTRAPPALRSDARAGAGWPDVLARTCREAMDDRLLTVSASVAFYALLAFAPALAVAVTLYGLFGDPARLAAFPGALAAVLPADAVKLVQDQATRLASESPRALSVKLIASLAVSLWGASSAVKALFDALNIIYETVESRSFVKLSLTALATTASGVFVFLAAVSVIGASPHFLALGPVSAEAVWIFALLRWPLFVLFAVAAIAGLNRVGPSRRRARLAE